MSIETQAVRVAAVAAAMVEDCQRPAGPQPAAPTECRSRTQWWAPIEMVLGLVHDERRRLAAQWGEQPRPPLDWLMALAEEVGRLAAAVAGPEPADARSAEVARHLQEAGQEAAKWLAGRTRP